MDATSGHESEVTRKLGQQWRIHWNKMKLSAHVLFRKDLSLILWKPRGVLDQSTVNEIVAFIEAVEKRNSKPFNRFADLSALELST
jgi:hypothetical protein